MSHKLHLNSPLPVKFLFEREDHQHLVHVLPYGSNAAATPSPDLRAYVVDYRHAQAFHFFCQPQVKIREIQEYGDFGRTIQ